MEKVAEHINEMQRIHEEYGAIFDHLFRQHQKACKQPSDVNPGITAFIIYAVNKQLNNRMYYYFIFIIIEQSAFSTPVICSTMAASSG